MTEPDEISELFGIFHDGWISQAVITGEGVEIGVQVEYLAERVRMGFKVFQIRLIGPDHLRFSPWPDEGMPMIPVITELEQIASMELGVLSAESKGHMVRVACSQDRPNVGFCGGFLEFEADRCRVYDELGREWTLKELRQLSDDYWSDWSARNKIAQQANSPDGG